LGGSGADSHEVVFSKLVADLDMPQGKVGYCHPLASDSMMEG
jgi:hypothetical protein